MMRLWTESYAKRPSVLPIAGLSALVHVVVIAACVLDTLPHGDLTPDSITNRAFYIPPPDRPPVPHGTSEGVHYVELIGSGSGFGSRAGDNAPQPAALTPLANPDIGDLTHVVDSVPPLPSFGDSVFTVVQVDSEVTRAENSVSPAYPADLIHKGIEGAVRARYIVDTTGFADMASMQILDSTDPAFTASVRAALPYMRFHPAKIGPMRVRQLVEQSFTFRIQRPADAQPATRRPSQP